MDITPVIRSCQSIGLTQMAMLEYEMLVLKKLEFDLTGSHLTPFLHLSPPVIILTLPPSIYSTYTSVLPKLLLCYRSIQ